MNFETYFAREFFRLKPCTYMVNMHPNSRRLLNERRYLPSPQGDPRGATLFEYIPIWANCSGASPVDPLGCRGLLTAWLDIGFQIPLNIYQDEENLGV
jgi:hypothetical protein